MKNREAISEGILLLSAILLTVTLPHHSTTTTQPTTSIAQTAPATTTAAAPATQAIEPSRLIVVSLEDRRLALIEDGQVKQVYTVAVGKDSTPSPTGTFTIVRRVANPSYTHDGQVIPPGPDNPVGTRWMGLSKPGYGIHGTNAPHSIGKAASHGCIRMARGDLENLYAQVHTGDTVEIIGQRDAQTIAIFGVQDSPIAPAAAPTALAQNQQPAAQPGTVDTTTTTTTIAAAIPIAR